MLSLALVFYFADLPQLFVALQMADYRLIALAVGMSFLWLTFRSLVWRTLLQENASFSQVFQKVNEGYLLNNLLPFRLGEAGRAFLLSRKANLDFFYVLSTIVIERSLDLAFAAGLLFCTFPFIVRVDWAQQAAIISGLLVSIWIFMLYLLAINRDNILGWLTEPYVGDSLLIRGSRKIAVKFLSGLSALVDWKRFLRTILWMGLNWLVAVGQYHFFLRAFIPEADLFWACFCLGVVALGVAVPSSPGSLGVYELSAVGALAVFGVNPSVALALAITIHISQYLITGIFGSYALARDGESLLGLFQHLRRMRHNQEL